MQGVFIYLEPHEQSSRLISYTRDSRCKIEIQSLECKDRSSRAVVQSPRDSRKHFDPSSCRSDVKHLQSTRAGVTQLVECHLAKVDVESSNLFSRSKKKPLETEGAFICLLQISELFEITTLFLPECLA